MTQAVTTNQVVTFPNSCFTVLGKVKVVIKPFGKGELKFYDQNLKPEEVDNTEVLLVRLGSSGAYMVAKHRLDTNQYEFCDIVRRTVEAYEAPWYLLDFIGHKVNTSKLAIPVFVSVHLSNSIRCTIPNAERMWIIVEDIVEKPEALIAEG